MTPALESLGRRWIAAGGGWKEGMRCLPDSEGIKVDRRVVAVDRYTHMGHYTGEYVVAAISFLSDVPDLSDPATLGACLAVVRERWGKPRLHASPSGLVAWYVGDGVCTIVPGVATEAEALIAALEAAPKERG